MTDHAGRNELPVNAVRSPAGRVPDMDDQQFAAWTHLLESRLGIFIAPERRSFLASGIRARMRETGCDSSREYYAQLTGRPGQAHEWSLLTDQLTVHETCFFRHDASLRLIADMLLPAWLERDRHVRAWSVGCATGEEAYSLAMLIDHAVAGFGGGRGYTVTGTDISEPALQHAREGVYLKRRLRDIPANFQDAYCVASSDRRFRVSDGLRGRVSFSVLNLRDLATAAREKVNLIYCQNLLIYYARERRVQIVDELVDFLSPGGVLILGPGELLDWQHPNMERVRDKDTLAYRRMN